MSRAVLAPFEAYQKARVTFVQTVAELAQRPQNIEALQSAGKLTNQSRPDEHVVVSRSTEQSKAFFYLIVFDCLHLKIMKLKLIALSHNFRRYGSPKTPSLGQCALHLAVGRAGPRPSRQLLRRAG